MADQRRVRNTFQAGSCDGKVRFDSAKLAYAVVKQRHIKGRTAYRCPHCGGWHLSDNASKLRAWRGRS